MILASALALILGEPAAANQAGNIDDLTNILNKPPPGGGDQADCEPQGLSLLGVKMQNAMGGADRLRRSHPARVKLDEAGKPIVAASSAAQMATASITGLTNRIPGLEDAVGKASDDLESGEAQWRIVNTVCQCERKDNCNIPPAEKDLKILEQLKVQVIYHDMKNHKKYLAYKPKEGEQVDTLIIDADANVGGDCIPWIDADLDWLRQQLQARQDELKTAQQEKASQDLKLTQAQQDLSKAKAVYGGLLQAAEAIANAACGSEQPAAQ